MSQPTCCGVQPSTATIQPGYNRSTTKVQPQRIAAARIARACLVLWLWVMAGEEAGARTADDVMSMVGGGGGGARRTGWVDVMQSRLRQRQCSAGCGKGGEGGEGQGGMRGGGQQRGGGDRGRRRGRRRRRLGGKGRGERRWRGRLDWLADGHRGQLVEVRRSRGRGSQLAHSPVEGADGAGVTLVAGLAHAVVDDSIDGRVELKGEVGGIGRGLPLQRLLNLPQPNTGQRRSTMEKG